MRWFVFFFVQVLGINSALTNVMVTNEPISEPECATDLFELVAHPGALPYTE